MIFMIGILERYSINKLEDVFLRNVISEVDAHLT